MTDAQAGFVRMAKIIANEAVAFMARKTGHRPADIEAVIAANPDGKTACYFHQLVAHAVSELFKDATP